jgi:methyl acetate hydrolase
MKFIRMMLNDGAGAQHRVLQPETVAFMSANGLGALKSGGFKTSQPATSNDGEFFAGLSKSWAYTFMVNDEDAPTGRPAGSLMWTGLANLYYWIDRKNGIGGLLAAQVIPFFDVAAYPAFLDFESAVYRSLRA